MHHEQPYQPRYRLIPYHPFSGPYATERMFEMRNHRGYTLEIGPLGVLVSPAVGALPFMLNGSYMLFVSEMDAKQFVDSWVSTVPSPPQRQLPVQRHEPNLHVSSSHAQQTEPLQFHLCAQDPLRGHRVKFASYRGYWLAVGQHGGCTITHPEYGPYKINGSYVLFADEQVAHAHIDSWYQQNLPPQRVP